MPKIALLPPNLINQIAAGEVVERPASVVKELVENSLDAGATRVEVTLRKAGRELIEIADDGCGMTEEDARLSLERHATSKITNFEDLLRVGTMGFRGEALPSIASISYLTLRTRAQGMESAFELRVEGGKKTAESPASGARGTTIRVEHLFYNVPARRKFLKSDATELGACVEAVKSLALANPGVGFKLAEGRRTILELPPGQTLRARLEGLYGKTLGALKELRAYEDQSSLEGFVSPVGMSQPTRERIFFFVNRRCVESKIFSIALREVYGPTMTRGHYPSAFIFLSLPPAEVDVNVHPAKREVRFRSEREKMMFVIHALAAVLNPGMTAPMMQTANQLPSFAPTPPPVESYTPTQSPFEGKTVAPIAFSSGTLTPFAASVPLASPTQGAFTLAEAVPSRHGWQFLAFLKRTHSPTHALFSAPEGLAIVAVGNAQERIAFEKIEKASREGAPSQALLTPALLKLEGALAEALRQNAALLKKEGFAVAEFGKGTWRLEAVPAWLSAENGFHGEPEKLFLAELGVLAEEGSRDESAKHRRLATLAAQHSRVELAHPQAALRLIDDLLACQSPLKTPDGRPTVWMVTAEELQKRFGGK